MEKFTIETERLVIRPLTEGGYIAWYQGFDNRHESQHAFDDGRLDMTACDLKWFHSLVARQLLKNWGLSMNVAGPNLPLKIVSGSTGTFTVRIYMTSP